jgi:PGF-CTERM protein
VDQSRFLDAVAVTGGPDSRALARELTETSAAAETWNRSVHARVFGLADPDYRFASFRVAGPYRNTTVDRLPTLVPGERVTVRAVARNNGTEAGDYAVTLRAGDRAVGTRSGRLAPGETARLAWTVPFDAAGESRLALGASTRQVTIRPAATPRVTALRTPDRVGVGESVRVRATVRNRAGRPAGATVALRADGETLTERRVRLVPGTSTVVGGRTTFPSPGEYTVAAGDRTATVRVVADTPTPTAPDDGDDPTGTATPTPVTPTVAQGPGFGITAAVAAVALAVLLGRRRRNR